MKISTSAAETLTLGRPSREHDYNATKFDVFGRNSVVRGQKFMIEPYQQLRKMDELAVVEFNEAVDAFNINRGPNKVAKFEACKLHSNVPL
jgi:hypothetical protein